MSTPFNFIPPDEPTAVYPIGKLSKPPDEQEEEHEEEEGVTETSSPPLEASVTGQQQGGFNPAIAVAVIGVGAVLAGGLVAGMAVILLLMQ